MILKPLSEHLQEALKKAELNWVSTYFIGRRGEDGNIDLYEYDRTQNALDLIRITLRDSWITIAYHTFEDASKWPNKSFDLTNPESIDDITEAICESIKHAYNTEHCGLFR